MKEAFYTINYIYFFGVGVVLGVTSLFYLGSDEQLQAQLSDFPTFMLARMAFNEAILVILLLFLFLANFIFRKSVDFRIRLRLVFKAFLWLTLLSVFFVLANYLFRPKPKLQEISEMGKVDYAIDNIKPFRDSITKYIGSNEVNVCHLTEKENHDIVTWSVYNNLPYIVTKEHAIKVINGKYLILESSTNPLTEESKKDSLTQKLVKEGILSFDPKDNLWMECGPSLRAAICKTDASKSTVFSSAEIARMEEVNLRNGKVPDESIFYPDCEK